MNLALPASEQLETLHKMEEWLRNHEDYRSMLNQAVFTISNKMGVHPHDLAIYILIRTASI